MRDKKLKKYTILIILNNFVMVGGLALILKGFLIQSTLWVWLGIISCMITLILSEVYSYLYDKREDELESIGAFAEEE